MKKLLDEGVDVNTRFRYDATALFYACDHGHLEVVKVLLERGADMSIKDTFYGFTPLGAGHRPGTEEEAGALRDREAADPEGSAGQGGGADRRQRVG